MDSNWLLLSLPILLALCSYVLGYCHGYARGHDAAMDFVEAEVTAMIDRKEQQRKIWHD